VSNILATLVVKVVMRACHRLLRILSLSVDFRE
jgi:hypothetical protein